MKSEKLREFYDLCQEYRHTPMDSIVAVAGAYERLVKFVDALVDEKLPDTTPRAGDICVSCGESAPHMECSEIIRERRKALMGDAEKDSSR